jgi:hypothetical protein
MIPLGLAQLLPSGPYWKLLLFLEAFAVSCQILAAALDAWPFGKRGYTILPAVYQKT